MNCCFFIGNLARDVNLKASETGNPYCRICLAVQRPVRSGEEKQADFFELVAFGKTAETIAKYCKKGSKIAVECSIYINKYETKEGEKRTSVEGTIRSLELLSTSSSQEAKIDAETAKKEAAKQAFYDDSEMPF